MRGDMSLVGPRPLWVDEASRCRGWTKKRLDITPGITGLWQVTGRNDVPFDEMVKLDYMYVTGWTLSWDIKLLLETLPAVLGKRGADQAAGRGRQARRLPGAAGFLRGRSPPPRVVHEGDRHAGRRVEHRRPEGHEGAVAHRGARRARLDVHRRWAAATEEIRR